jgi:hypothetical protein
MKEAIRRPPPSISGGGAKIQMDQASSNPPNAIHAPRARQQKSPAETGLSGLPVLLLEFAADQILDEISARPAPGKIRLRSAGDGRWHF